MFEVCFISELKSHIILIQYSKVISDLILAVILVEAINMIMLRSGVFLLICITLLFILCLFVGMHEPW